MLCWLKEKMGSLLYQEQDVFDTFDEGDCQQNGINNKNVKPTEG
jgi:hypothetical protein